MSWKPVQYKLQPLQLLKMKNFILNPAKASKEILRESAKSLNLENNLAIPIKKHLEEVKSLAETIKYERFFFVVDVLTQSIKYPHGLLQWLGYKDEEFTFEKYSSIIHPNHIEAVFLLAKSIFAFSNSNLFYLEFMKEKYVIDVALRHAKGHYVLVKRTLSCWQYSPNQNIITAYLNEFAVWGEFDEENSKGIRPRLTDLYGGKLNIYDMAVRDSSFKTLESNKRFSVQELRILRKYAYNPAITANDVAVSFKIKISSVETYNRRILTKFNNIYPNEQVKSAKEVASFLRKEYFI